MKPKKFATLRDIAKLAGTSVTSVSYILSGDQKRYVSDELRQKVLKAADELNYVKSALATGLKGQNRKMLAMLVPQFDNIFFTRLTAGVEEVAYKHGYILNVCNSLDNSEREREIIENLVMHRIDGILISPTESSADNIRYIRDFGIPFMVVDRALNDMTDCDAVLTDNLNAGYLAAKLLLEAGHRSIAFVEWQTKIPNLKDRLWGCVKAFEEAKLPKEHILSLSYQDLKNTQGSQIAAEITKAGEVTGVIFGHHNLAEKFFGYVFQNKIAAIVDSLSFVMIGNPVWSNFCHPLITCIDPREHEIGREAALRLIKKIEAEDERNMASPTSIVIGCKIKPGDSVKKLTGSAHPKP